MTTITVRKQSPSKKLFLTAVGGGLVALTVAVSLGYSQNRDHSTAAGPAVVAGHTRAVTLPAENQASAFPNQEQNARWQARRDAGAGTGGAATFYIVATDEEAGQLWEAVNIAPEGPLGSISAVIVLDPAADSVVLQALTELESIRHDLGLPPVRIIDTRGS